MYKKNTLYYFHDPMCSWCWGFRRVWLLVEKELEKIEIVYQCGGLAKDSDITMPNDMQQMIQKYWRTVEQKTKSKFNFDFWHQCNPKRSTYPSCRAVISAKNQNKEREMIYAVQQAYYINAQNPSEYSTLIQLAKQIKLDIKAFEKDIYSNEVEIEFKKQRDNYLHLSNKGFPSLILCAGNKSYNIDTDYSNEKNIINSINKLS